LAQGLSQLGKTGFPAPPFGLNPAEAPGALLATDYNSMLIFMVIYALRA